MLLQLNMCFDQMYKTNFPKGTLLFLHQKRINLHFHGKAKEIKHGSKGFYFFFPFHDKHRKLLFSLTGDTCSVLYNLSLQNWIRSSDLQPVTFGSGKPAGLPISHLYSTLTTTPFVILMLFYENRNSRIMSFRKKKTGGENILITSLSSQRLTALHFVKQNTIRT